jgi:polysaccharide export outer membrane protein
MRILACLLLLLAGACSPGRDLPDLQLSVSNPYRLGPGDVVRVIVVGEDTLSGEFRVSDSGSVALPMLGFVLATGLTPDQLADRVRAALVRADLHTAPSVSIEVTAYRPIFVLGEVAKPGQYPYQPGMTVVTAAAVAGGFTYRAVNDFASVTRTSGGIAVEARANRQSLILPGDVITIFERRF